mgnify:CR=1 FL=1
MSNLPRTLAVPLLTALLAASGCSPTPPAQPPLRVQATPLTERAFSDSLDTVSTLEARDEVELAAQAGGRVLRLLVRSGQPVRAGQLLLVLDQTQLRAEVAALRAEAERDRLNDQRYQQLVAQGAATAIQRDQYRAAAIASREALRARLADLAYKDLRAPIDGVLGDVTVKPGDLLQVSTPFSRIIRNQRLQARIDVPASRAAEIRPGLTVELLLGPGATVQARGTITMIDPGVNAGSQTLLAKADIANPSGGLRNGQRLRTRVLLRERRLPGVPFSAVSRQSGQAFVFVVGTLEQLQRDPGQAPLAAREGLPPGTAVALQRPVQLGPLQQGLFPVLGGLEPGDRVVNTSTLGLRHGAPVVVSR